MSTLDNCTNYKGEVTGYTPRANSYYHIRHRSDRIQEELKEFCQPFVEVGFDAQQIRTEMQQHGNQRARLIGIGQLEAIISLILGEQQ